MGCTSHAARRRTLISGLKMGALLINQWCSGGQQELGLSPRGHSHAGGCERLQCIRLLFHTGNLRLAAEIVAASECANSLNVLSKQLEL